MHQNCHSSLIPRFSGVRGVGAVPDPEEEQGPVHRLDQGLGRRQQQTGNLLYWKITLIKIKLSKRAKLIIFIDL